MPTIAAQPYAYTFDPARLALVIIDMQPHAREHYRQQMGHVWLGFSEDQIAGMLTEAGFAKTRIVPLAPDARAKGPGLFVATGDKGE